MRYTQLFLFAFLLIFISCESNGDNKESGASTMEEDVDLEHDFATLPDSIKLPDDLLDGMYPPYDVSPNASLVDQAIFAWREMIALSWQSTYTPSVPSRSNPDDEWDYTDGTPTRPLVWETFAHRIEYRPKGDVINLPYDSQPSYPFATPDSVTIDWNGINPSEHFVVLDEDNEIGSCFVFSEPNVTSPAVGDDLVLYMAKVNRAEYDYRKKYFNSSDALKSAIGKIFTSAEKDANGKVTKKAHTDTTKLADISLYTSPNALDPCGSAFYGDQGIIVFPCSDEASQQQGMMEIKTAWRPKTAEDNEKEFLVREAVSFTKDGNTYTAQVNQYVLLGMHIIHKTKNFRHFFIATWEHNSLEDYGYAFALDNNEVADRTAAPVMRHNDSDGAHSRNPLTYGPISDAVQARIREANPDNFLANYRLTGFQSDVYVDSPLAERKTTMPAYFLANLVIESDKMLTEFSGSGFGNPFDNGNNLVSAGKSITTGGCSGCHGAGAQLKGTDFSFLNDFTAKPIPFPDSRVLVDVEAAKVLDAKDYQ